MTIKELIEVLRQYPPDAEVRVIRPDAWSHVGAPKLEIHPKDGGVYFITTPDPEDVRDAGGPA